MACTSFCTCRVSVVERAAIKNIVEKIYEHKLDFEAEFMVMDPTDSGFVNASDWAETMTKVVQTCHAGSHCSLLWRRKKVLASVFCCITRRIAQWHSNVFALASPCLCGIVAQVTGLKLPWLTLKKSFVKVAENGKVDYRSCLDSIHLEKSPDGAGIIENEDSQVAQALYQHLGTLEYIFRLIDVDA